MAWTPEDIPDQRGRVAVVTGANSGLGLATARELARKGAHVVMATRNQTTAAQARDAIAAAVPGANLELRPLDLGNLASVRECADGIVADHGRVDVLVNNSGIMGIPERATDDGFEAQLGVNHLGHFVLTARLLPALRRAPAARVVTVTSFARFVGRAVDPDNPHQHGSYDPWRAYGQSKLANLHFAVELQRRFTAAGTSARSLAAHPGLSNTGLQARSVHDSGGGLSQRFWHFLARNAGMSASRGAWSQLRAATDPHARGGTLYGPRWVTFGPPVARRILRPSARPAALWALSERETGERFELAAPGDPGA